MGYRDVLNTIHESYEYISIGSSYILQLHRDLYKYSEKSIGGRYKNTQNVIAKTTPDGTQTVRFMLLDPYETLGAIDAIFINEIMELVPTIGKVSIENSLRKLVEENFIERHGKGKATFYTRTDK